MSAVTLTILGSGTSQGVPSIGCTCETCSSDDPRDKRLRTSALFQTKGRNILIDLSSDFRQQMLRTDVRRLDAILLTHHHFDHIGGFDDLRQFNYLQRAPMQVYGMEETLAELRTTFRYAFGEALQEGGGVPAVTLHTIPNDAERMQLEGVEIALLRVYHGKMPVLGFRIGGIAYVTDTNRVPPEAVAGLQGLEVLVLDALRPEAHPTHFTLDEAVKTARDIRAEKTYFIHMTHNVKHERDEAKLPPGMAFSYDGLVITSGRDAV